MILYTCYAVGSRLCRAHQSVIEHGVGRGVERGVAHATCNPSSNLCPAAVPESPVLRLFVEGPSA